MDRAHYSLHVDGNTLEGSYHEDDVDDGSRTNEMVVRVLFDDAKSGQFQLAKIKAPKAPEPGQEPEPQPLPEPRTVFEFDFRAQSDERFHLSESAWLKKEHEKVQFLALDEDTFVVTRVGERGAAHSSPRWPRTRGRLSRAAGPPPRTLLTRLRAHASQTTAACALDQPAGAEPACKPSVTMSAWTAVRQGAPRGGRRAAAAEDGKRTLLSRYGWYIFFGMLYCGYKAAMEKAQATMAGMQSKKAK